MSFTDKLFIFALLLFTKYLAILNTRSLAALVAITQNVFTARSLRAGSSNLWFRNNGECHYTQGRRNGGAWREHCPLSF